MLLFSPILLALCLHMGLAYAYFYLLFTTFTPIFQNNYGFTTKTVGLSYLGVGIGFLIGQACFAKLGDAILLTLAKKNGGEMKPEYRLPLACVGGVFIPVGFFWYGWAVQGRVAWIVPILGTVVIGLGNSLIFVSHAHYAKHLVLLCDADELTVADRNPSVHYRRLRALCRVWARGQYSDALRYGSCFTPCRTEDVCDARIGMGKFPACVSGAGDGAASGAVICVWSEDEGLERGEVEEVMRFETTELLS
jgi:hypothetical protein